MKLSERGEARIGGVRVCSAEAVQRSGVNFILLKLVGTFIIPRLFSTKPEPLSKGDYKKAPPQTGERSP